jgi:hypothetical protein
MKRLALMLCLLAWPASAHSWYTGLLNSRGQDCCGGEHCAPVAPGDLGTDADGNFEVYRDRQWYAVDPANILGSPSLDGVIHACIWGGVVRCFILPARM